jgi:ABC-type transporter Mla subunit MlaD
MAKISTRTTTDLIIHIGIILGLMAVLFLGFFFLYLPFTTHHGQTITVPDLSRMNTSELEDF